MPFNDTTTYNGLVQAFEREIGATRGDVSGSTDRLKEFASDVNRSLDDFTRIAIESSGTWQWDDSNQTDYPIITSNIVSGQRDYAFTTDGSGNFVLDIYKVAILASATTSVYQELQAADISSEEFSTFVANDITATGVPWRYDKLANAIFFDPIPNYSATNGLKVYINRTASYFASTDLTKKPGIPAIFHSYLYLAAAHRYAARNSMPIAGGRLRNGAFTGLLMEVNDLETQIKKYFALREQDVRHVIKPRITPYL